MIRAAACGGGKCAAMEEKRVMKPENKQPGPQIPMDPFDLPEPVQEPVPETKKPEPAPEPKKKSGGLLPGILVGVAAAVVLLLGYRFIHIWSDATCTEQAECSICGQVKEGYADHAWVSGTCEAPMVCSVCGEVAEQAKGHSFLDDTCTVCGETRKVKILRWTDLGYEAVYEYDAVNSVLSVEAPGLEKFAEDKISILDYTGEKELNPERYTVSRSDGKVYIDLPADLEPGRYTVCSGYFQTKVADFCLGTENDAIPTAANCWFADFVAVNRMHRFYLAAFEEDAPLRGMPVETEATRFDTPWQMCAMGIDAAGNAVLIPGEPKQQFVVDEHWICFQDDTEFVFTFRYDKWYLAMDADGTVYLTDDLAENCYWFIASSL